MPAPLLYLYRYNYLNDDRFVGYSLLVRVATTSSSNAATSSSATCLLEYIWGCCLVDYTTDTRNVFVRTFPSICNVIVLYFNCYYSVKGRLNPAAVHAPTPRGVLPEDRLISQNHKRSYHSRINGLDNDLQYNTRFLLSPTPPPSSFFLIQLNCHTERLAASQENI